MSNLRPMGDFYQELAVRVVALANALQYENAVNLLRLALSASDDPPPDVLEEANVEFSMAFSREGYYDHARFDEAVASMEKWLETRDGGV